MRVSQVVAAGVQIIDLTTRVQGRVTRIDCKLRVLIRTGVVIRETEEEEVARGGIPVQTCVKRVVFSNLGLLVKVVTNQTVRARGQRKSIHVVL